MGFPVPLKEWLSGAHKGMVSDIFSIQKSRHHAWFNSDAILANFDQSKQFSRKTWGQLSLELWQQRLHDRVHEFRRMLDDAAPAGIAAQ